jgi:undecaprenyl-diphosphatase
MDKAMKVPEYISNPLVLAAGNLGVFYFGGESERHAAKLAVTSWTGTALTTFVLKSAFNRERPAKESPRYNSSFPSGHTANWFSLATVYSAKYPKLAIPLYATGLVVGLSRIYQGEHYPSDVLVGAAIGVGVGYLTLKLEKQLAKLPFF